MRSLERSHRKTDLDQVDPEHLNRESLESPWGTLSEVPFRGNQNSGRIDRDEAIKTRRRLQSLFDDLEAEGGDEIKQREIEKARQDVHEALFNKIEEVGSFGRNARNQRNLPSKNERTKDTETSYKDLTDISSTF